jgi:hypothetical protein
MVVPKTNQEINEPSYEMVGVKITVTYYGQNKSYFWHHSDLISLFDKLDKNIEIGNNE